MSRKKNKKRTNIPENAPAKEELLNTDTVVEAEEPEKDAAEGEETKEDTAEETVSANDDETVTAVDADEDTEEEEDTDDPDNGSKGIFGFRDKKALAEKDEKIAELNDRYLRLMAEYENFRKRSEKEKSDIYGYAVRDVMAKLLPVLDNIERAVAAVPEDQAEDPFAKGLEQIRKQFEKALTDAGVTVIPAKGEPFDPAFHNAVMHVEDDEIEESTVVEEFQKGYMYRDLVVRPSMVKVAN